MKKALLIIALVASRLGAQQPRDPKPIQDNSFLLEEAYNQEPAVIQHISNLFFDRTASNWLYVLTDEWPLGSQRHQLSFTLPLLNVPGSGAGLGDVAINYRLQLVGSGDTRLAVTPRLSFILPTASDRLGGGTFAWQPALASSYEAMRSIVLHTNAAITLTPNAETGAGGKAGLVDLLAGQSVVWLAHPRFNVLVEGVITSVEEFTGVGTDRSRATGFTLSPGVRWSHDFASGLQVVPGFAFPIGFRANSGQRGVFLYLSFEHELPGLPK